MVSSVWGAHPSTGAADLVLYAAAPELNAQLGRGEKNLGPGILSVGGAARPAAGEGAPRRAHFSALCVPREPVGRTNLRGPEQPNWENVPASSRIPDFCTTIMVM